MTVKRVCITSGFNSRKSIKIFQSYDCHLVSWFTVYIDASLTICDLVTLNFTVIFCHITSVYHCTHNERLIQYHNNDLIIIIIIFSFNIVKGYLVQDISACAQPYIEYTIYICHAGQQWQHSDCHAGQQREARHGPSSVQRPTYINTFRLTFIFIIYYAYN